MKNGIFRDDEGFHVMVDGVDRVFSGEKPGALAMARELKRRNSGSKIQIRDRSNGGLSEMLDDGRIR
jgi:hypothetical protein